MSVCHNCGIPWDAGVFDESKIYELQPANPEGQSLEPGQELVLVRYELHRNYCGALLYFAQFTDRYASDPTRVLTPGYQWQLRSWGQPLDPYLTFDHIINPWGMAGFPLHMRLGEGTGLELVIRNLNAQGEDRLRLVGGRMLGRYWYNTNYGGAPNPL